MISLGGSLLFIVLLAGTVVTVTLVIIGRRDPAQPRCTACQALISPVALVRAEPCPVCGAELSGARALRTSWRGPSARVWILFAAIVLLWPSLILLTRWAATRGRPAGVAAMPGATTVQSMSTDALIVAAMAESRGLTPATSELLRRIEAGTVDLPAARATLTSELLRMRGSATPPVNTDMTSPLVIAGALMPPDRGEDPADHALMDALLDLFAPAPTVSANRSVAGHLVLEIRAPGLPVATPARLEALLMLEGIMAGDRTVRFGRTPPRRRSAGEASPSDPLVIRHGAVTVMVPMEDLGDSAELVLDFQSLLYERFDAERALGYSGRGSRAEDRPAPLRSKSRRVTVSVPGTAP